MRERKKTDVKERRDEDKQINERRKETLEEKGRNEMKTRQRENTINRRHSGNKRRLQRGMKAAQKPGIFGIFAECLFPFAPDFFGVALYAFLRHTSTLYR